MGSLIYSTLGSLDGYIEDRGGKFDWAMPDEQVHRFVNELERPVGTYLYGRRMYETMVYWETVELADQPEHVRDYAAIWRAADKIVYSKTLEAASSARTRIERDFDPEAIRRLRAEGEISIGGPGLAAEAIRAGLLDEYRTFLAPVVIGDGKRALPDDARFELELLDERRFDSGFVYLRYAVA